MIGVQQIKIVFVLLIGSLLLITGCGSKSEGYSFTKGDVEFNEDDYQKIIPANNELAFQLVTRVEADDEQNLFISPTSVLMALSMVYNGADGTTKEEMAKALQLAGIEADTLNQANASLGTKLYKDTNEIILYMANSIWINELYQFQKEFKQATEDYYNAKVQEIDIYERKSSNLINDWVKEATNGMIDEIVPEQLDEDLLALIINAIYFKGKWMYAFDQDQTQDSTFYLDDGTTTEASFMHLQEDLLYMDNDHLQAVQLPYGNGEMSMQIFLPHEHLPIAQFAEMLTSDNWSLWQDSFYEKEGTVILPKFKLSYETSLNQALKELGMQEAFAPTSANFSKMITDDADIYISDVKQKTFIEVSEEGTEASAVTSVEMKVASLPVDGPFNMEVNRPFMFTIVDNETKAILFIGIMQQPVFNE